MKILVDTNVIIDALTSREPFREDAEQIFLLAANQIEDIFLHQSKEKLFQLMQHYTQLIHHNVQKSYFKTRHTL